MSLPYPSAAAAPAARHAVPGRSLSRPDVRRGGSIPNYSGLWPASFPGGSLPYCGTKGWEGPGAIRAGTFNNLKCIIRTYVREHDIERDPTNGIRGFDTSLHRTYTRENPNALLPAEVPVFLAKARQMYPHHFAMLALGFNLGLRTCSLRPLRRKGPHADVDLDAAMLLNRRSHTEGQRVMERTKIGIDQDIPLPPELVAILREHIANLPPGPMQKSDLLFPGPDGLIQSRHQLWLIVRKVAAAIGLPKRFTPHGMRRTNKDLLRVTGASQVVAMAISGHLTETMHNHYSTVGEAEQRESLDRVVSLMNLAAVISPASGGEENGEDRPSDTDPASNLRRENIQPSQISTTPVRHLTVDLWVQNSMGGGSATADQLAVPALSLGSGTMRRRMGRPQRVTGRVWRAW